MNRFLQVWLVCFAVACGSSDKGLDPEEISHFYPKAIFCSRMLPSARCSASIRVRETAPLSPTASAVFPDRIARDTNGDLLMTLSESSLPIVLRFDVRTGDLFIVSSGR